MTLLEFNVHVENTIKSFNETHGEKDFNEILDLYNTALQCLMTTFECPMMNEMRNIITSSTPVRKGI